MAFKFSRNIKVLDLELGYWVSYSDDIIPIHDVYLWSQKSESGTYVYEQKFYSVYHLISNADSVKCDVFPSPHLYKMIQDSELTD